MSETLERIKIAYAGWADSAGTDPGVWEDLIADDITLECVGADNPGMKHAIRGRGVDVAHAYMRGLSEAWEIESLTPEAFLEDGDRIAMLGRVVARNRRTDERFESRKIDILDIAGGRIVRFEEIYDTHAAMVAAGTA